MNLMFSNLNIFERLTKIVNTQNTKTLDGFKKP